jgi:hypothetical protein
MTNKGGLSWHRQTKRENFECGQNGALMIGIYLDSHDFNGKNICEFGWTNILIGKKIIGL